MKKIYPTNIYCSFNNKKLADVLTSWLCQKNLLTKITCYTDFKTRWSGFHIGFFVGGGGGGGGLRHVGDFGACPIEIMLIDDKF